MASTAISALTIALSAQGGTSQTGTITLSNQTCTITGPTGGQLDLNSLLLKITTSNATSSAAIVTIEGAASSYSGIGQGGYGTFAVGTSQTIYIGGKGLESARFLNASEQSLILSFVSSTGSANSCDCSITAIQFPFEITG